MNRRAFLRAIIAVPLAVTAASHLSRVTIRPPQGWYRDYFFEQEAFAERYLRPAVNAWWDRHDALLQARVEGLSAR